MAEIRRLIQWGLILTLLTVLVIGVAAYLLYHTALDNERRDLHDIVTSQAALIQAVARFDRTHTPELGADGTFSQIRDAFTEYQGLGRTGELVLGSMEGGEPTILLHQRGHASGDAGKQTRHRHGELPRGLGQPLRRALEGGSGTVIAPDYDGTRVLAAYRPLPELGWGLVAKRDLAAIRAPYIRTALATGGLGIGLVVLAGFLFGRASDPLIQRLKRSEARWARLFENAGEGIVVTDQEGRVQFANPRARALFAVPEHVDVAGTSVFEFLPEMDRQTLRERLQERVEGRSEHYQFTFHHPDGERLLDIHATPLPGPEGGIEGSLALIEDVTEQHQAQEALARERQLLGTVIEALPVAIWILDGEGHFLRHNPFAETLWARTDWERPQPGAEFPQFKAWDAETGAPLAPDDWVASTTLREGRKAAGQVVEIEADDGTHRFLRNASIPLRDPEGELEKVVVVSEDITEERRIQEDLHQEQDLLQQVLDTLPIGVWVVDAAGQFVRHNPAGEAIWRGARYEGGQEAYAEYKGWWADTGEEIAPQEWAVARAINQGETSLNEVIDIQCFDGSIRTILNASVPMFDADGSIRGAIIVNEDITQRRAMERMLQRNEELLERVLENLPVGVAVTDEQGRFILTNQMDTVIWGENRVGHTAGEFRGFAIHEADREPVTAGSWPMERALREGDTVLEEAIEIIRADETTAVLAISSAPILGSDGALWGGAEIVQDITARRQAEAEHKRLSDALRQTADAVYLMDRQGRIEYVNPAFEQITGFSLEEARGHRPEELLDPGRLPAGYFTAMWESLLRGEVFRDVVLNRAKDGRLFHWETTLSPLVAGDGSVVSVVGTASDLTEQEQLRDQLHTATRYDPLTELPNRDLLLERLHDALARGEWSERFTALALLDVDNFTLVNDSLGHRVGDELLRDLGRRLAGAVREGDLVARTGGDGFGLMLSEVAAAEDVPAVLRDLMAALTAPYEIAGQTTPVSVTMGAAVAPQDATDADTLFRHADTALAQAKHADEGGIHFYAEEMGKRARRKLTLERGLRQALEEDALALHYQPQVDLHSGRLRGLEALLRWDHPEWGPVSPGEFIPVAEQSGLIRPIGEWVLERALRDSGRWREQGLETGYVSVNLSPAQLADPELPGKITALLEGSDGADRLELEITETALMSRLETGSATLGELSELGIHLAVDDFGTGYSSLAYLSRLPLDSLKIDRSFVGDLETKGENASIVLSVISLAHSLGLEVIAEGVETEDQLQFLRRSNCDMVQGFYLGRPTPATELPALLARESWL